MKFYDQKKKFYAGLCSFLLLGSIVCGEDNKPAEHPRMTEAKEMLKSGKFTEAEKILQEFARQNNAEAYHYLGCLAFHQKKLELSAAYHTKASKLGNMKSRYTLAVMTGGGFGVKKDPAKAYQLFKEVADQTNDPNANFQTGRLLILGEGTKADLKLAEYYLKRSSDAENINGKNIGNKNAQFLLGNYYLQEKNFEKAYHYLEMTAAKNNPEAWCLLGNLYLEGKGLDKPDYAWAKLCYQAAERIKPDAVTEYHIGLCAEKTGDAEETLKWMKCSAGKKFAPAENYLKNPENLKKIKAVKKKAEKQENPLADSINAHFSSTSRMLGVDARTVIAQIDGLPELKDHAKMIRLPQPENIRMHGWIFDPAPVQKKISAKLKTDREGNSRWVYDEFLTCPIQENLAYLNPTIRAINAEYEDALIGALKKSVYQKLDKNAVEKMIKSIDEMDWRESAEHDIWKIRDGLYFNVFADFSGRWQLRYYRFLSSRNGKTEVLISFSTPPGMDDADMLEGILRGNDDCMNNLAVKIAEGETDLIFRHDEEAEEIFLALIRKKHAAAAYNLAILYQNQGKKKESERYFKLAKEFSASAAKQR